jgi:hypothetical protein
MASKSIGLLNIVFGADLRGFERAMKKAQRSIKKFGSSMKRTGANLSRNLTLPIIGLGAIALKTFADFEQSMLKVKAVSGATGEQFKMLTDNAKALGAATMFSASQVADLQFELAKLGFKPEEIKDATGNILALAQATSTDLAESGRIAAIALNSFNAEASESGKFADIMALASSAAAMDMEKFGSALPVVGATARLAGDDFEGLSAKLMVLADAGMEGSSMGTHLNKIYSKLAKSGLTWDEGMQKLIKSNFSIVLAQEMFGERAFKSALILAENTKKTNELTEANRNAAGASKEMAAIMDAGVTGAMRRMKSQMEGIAIEMGGHLVPVFEAVIEKVSKLIEWFGSLSDETKKNIVKWGLVVAAIGPLLMIFGQLSLGVSALIPIFVKLGAVMLANPYLAVAAAIGAIGLAAFRATSQYNKFADVMGAVTDANQKAEKSILEQKIKVTDLTKVLKDENSTLEDKEKALNALNILAPEYYGKLTAAKIDVEKLDTATKDYIGTLRQEARAIAAKEKMIEIERKILDEQQKLKDQLPQGIGGAITGAIERQLVGSVGWERTAKRIGDLKKQAEELSKVLKTFPESDAAPTGGGPITTITGGGPITTITGGGGEDFTPTAIPTLGMETLGVETKGIFEPIKMEWEDTTKSMAEQTKYTVGVMISNFQEGMDKVKTIMSSVSGLISAVNEKEQAEFDILRDGKNEKLDEDYETQLERIENSIMNDEAKQTAIATLDETFAGKKADLDEQMEKKEKVIKRKQAVREKAMGIMNAIISTIEGVMGAVAALPLTGGLPMSAIIAGFGAAQVAAIASTPIPFAMGGLVSGPTLGLLGEGSGTSAFNPEVVSPLDRLMGMMGTSNVNVHGRIQGDNIVLVSDKAEISRQRFI